MDGIGLCGALQDFEHKNMGRPGEKFSVCRSRAKVARAPPAPDFRAGGVPLVQTF